MAADANLIKGARRVAKAQRKMEMAGYEGTQDVIDAGIETLSSIVNKKKANSGDWTEQAHKILDKAGELPNAEYLALFDNLDGEIKEQYNQAVVDGDKKKQAMILKDIADMGRDYADYKDIIHSLGKDYVSGTLSNNMLHYDETGQEIMKLLNGDEARLVKKRCEEGVPCDTEMGIMLPDFELINTANEHIDILNQQIDGIVSSGDYDGDGNWYATNEGDEDLLDSLNEKTNQYNAVLESSPTEWTSLQTLKSKIMKVDKSSSDLINATMQQAYNNGYNSSPEDPSTYDVEHARNQLETTILANGNFKSIVYDEMVLGRNFYEDFLSMIKGDSVGGVTYTDLGVSEEQLADADANGDDVVSHEEAENIAQFIINNNEEGEGGKTMIHDYVVNYFLSMFKRNHDKGLNNMLNNNKSKNQSKKDEEEEITALSFNSNAPKLT